MSSRRGVLKHMDRFAFVFNVLMNFKTYSGEERALVGSALITLEFIASLSYVI
jgi:hypothetical protein